MSSWGTAGTAEEGGIAGRSSWKNDPPVRGQGVRPGSTSLASIYTP